MKILMITEFFPTGKDLRFSGGVEARNFYLARNLAKRHQVTVVAARTSGKKENRMFGFTIHRVGPKRDYHAAAGDIIKRILFIRAAVSFVKKFDADIIDASNFIAHFIAGFTDRKKTPVIAWYPDVFLGSWIKNSGLVGILGEIIERINLKNIRSAIAITNSTAAKLKKYFAGKIYTIPCGVDPSEFKIKVAKQKNPTIICVSRLVGYKRVADLIWTFALLLKKNPSLRLVIVGRGPEENKLKNICRMTKIAPHVSFINNLTRTDLISTIKSSHLLCLPSQTEGFGIVLIEAAAAGIPYVASDIPALVEITKRGQGGLIFKTGHIKDLAEKISQLLTDRKLYQQKVKEGQALVKNYLWEDIARETEKVYQRLSQ